MYMKRAFLILPVTLIIVVFFFFQRKGEKQKKVNAPNIILIMADDLGYSDLSSYGSKIICTPNLDRLSSKGMKFTDFHSNGTVCSPTRAALLTGKYQQRVGIEGVITAAHHRDKGLALEETTFAEALKEAGYATGMFGKWHLGYDKKYNPFNQGFDEFKGYVSGNVDYFSHIDQEGFFDWWKDTLLRDDKGYSTHLITDYGIDFIKRHKNEPFLLYLPYETPHYPYQAPYSDAFRKEGVKQARVYEIHEDSLIVLYKDMVEVLDNDIGRLMNVIKYLGLSENTLVFFISDNGGVGKLGVHNYPLRGFKGGLYEGGHRVPAIVWWPGKIQEGSVSDETVMTMDIFPTMLDIVDKSKIKGLDGISFKNVLLSKGKLPERCLFWRFGNKKAVREGDWKLVITYDNNTKEESVELYNLKNSISENSNLAAKNESIVKDLLEKLKSWEAVINNNE